MRYTKTTRQVFDAWAQDHHADGMEEHHWPRVRPLFETIAPSRGAYLEIGVGNGYGLHRMATGPFANGRCVGLDVSPKMVALTRKRVSGLPNVELHCGDFLRWQVEPADHRFELIFSMEVFYYFEEIQAGLDTAASLLMPGGTLMVLVNYYTEHEASHAWPAQLDTPMRLWSSADYVHGFEKAGLCEVRQQRIRDAGAAAADPGTLATIGRKRSA